MKAIKTILLILGLVAVCSGVRADITGSNLMLADNTNSVRTSDDSSDWYSTSPGSDQWNDRGAGGTFVAAVDPVLGAIDVAYQGNSGASTEVRSTISGLIAGNRYNVWVLHSITTGTTRAISAAYDDGSELVKYDTNNSTYTELDSHGTDWLLQEVDLGGAIADENGEISVLVNWPGSGTERTVYHGLAYSTQNTAWNPSPADGTVRLFPEDNPPLQWNSGQDASIVEHVVYMGILNEPNDIAPELTEVARVALGDDPAGWNPSGQWEIKRDQFVYWQVNEAKVASTTDPNEMFVGSVWYFETASEYAEIEDVANVGAPVGADITFSVSATNPYTEPADSTGLSYQWYQGDDMDDPDKVLLTEGAKYTGVTATILGITNLVSGDEGRYFCEVTVDSNGKGASKSAYLFVERMVGHWKLDGNANDELGNDGIEVGTVTYPEGKIGDCVFLDNIDQDNESNVPSPVNHIEIPHSDGYREEVFTVSCWVNSLAPGFKDEHNYGGAVSKTDSAGDGPGWSMRKEGLGYYSRWFTYGSPAIVSDDADYFLSSSGWNHLVGVYDEENNFKAMYINGVLETSINDLGESTDILVADGDLYIGVDYAMRSPGELMIDDVRLYNYALDKFEIGQIYADATGEALCVEYPDADLDEDCDVDIDDLRLFVSQWLDCGMVPDCDI